MRTLAVYKSYSFRRKDPVIDKLRTMVRDEGLKEGQVADLSGVGGGTLKNWFHGKTMRPQFCTIAAVSNALGYEVAFVKAKTNGKHPEEGANSNYEVKKRSVIG